MGGLSLTSPGFQYMCMYQKV